MKSIKLFSISLLMTVLFISASFAQNSETFYASANFKVNASCGGCKSKVEKALNDTKGVKSSDLDVSTFVVAVSYDESLLTKEEIIKAIADAGYTAEIVEDDASTLKSSCNHDASKCSKNETSKACCSADSTKTSCSKEKSTSNCCSKTTETSTDEGCCTKAKSKRSAKSCAKKCDKSE